MKREFTKGTKITLILVGIVLLVFGGMLISEQIQIKRKEEMKAYLDIKHDEIEQLLIQDKLIYSSESSIDISEMITYHDMWSFNNLLKEVINSYKLNINECKLGDKEFQTCSRDRYDASYRYTEIDDMILIEVYENPDYTSLKYYKLEYKENEYLKVLEVSLNDSNEISHGEIFMYYPKDKIEYYELKDNQVNSYSNFTMDGHYNINYKNTASYTEVQHITSFDMIGRNDVGFSYNRDIDTLELDIFIISFKVEREDETKDFFLVHFENNEITRLKYDKSYIEGYETFYINVCLDETESMLYPNEGICAHYNAPIEMEDYDTERFEDVLSLKLFDLEFNQVTVTDIATAKQYFLSNYDTIFTQNNFDYQDLTFETNGINDIFTIDNDIVESLR